MVRLISYAAFYIAMLFCLGMAGYMAYYDRWVWAIVFIVLTICFIPQGSDDKK